METERNQRFVSLDHAIEQNQRLNHVCHVRVSPSSTAPPHTVAQHATHHKLSHWYASVLNKWFLTPFCDDIWNRRQVSVGDRGFHPTRPRNRRGYALLPHTLGKMRSCATGKRSNTEICTIELKKFNYTAKLFSAASTSHTVSPR